MLISFINVMANTEVLCVLSDIIEGIEYLSKILIIILKLKYIYSIRSQRILKCDNSSTLQRYFSSGIFFIYGI